MKFLVVFSCMVAMACCAALSEKDKLRQLPALRHEEVHDELGQYEIRYITAENTIVNERGYFVLNEEGEPVLHVEGQYQYVSDDGKVYLTKYRGGPNGFEVDGKHLPVPVVEPSHS